MEQYVIGVDIGTGSAKAVAVKYDGKPFAASQIYYKTNSPQPGYYEQDPEIIWNAFIKCINEIIVLVKQVPFSVSISSAMHSLLVINTKNFPVTPLITWEDTRSEKIAEALKKSGKGKSIYTSTGTPVHSMSPLCKIKWLKENQKGIFKNAFKFISIKEFIWYRLFNTYEIDYSIASATGLFNIEKLEWNKPSLHFCGIKSSQLSKPVATNFIRKNINNSIAAALNIPADTSFCIGASDGCLANLGSNSIKAGVAALTIGTSGAIRIASDKAVVNYAAMIFNYILDDTHFISGGPVNNGGNVVKWLFSIFLKNDNPSDDDFAELFKTIETIKPGCEGLLFLPYLYGERAPVWDGAASGVFIGIRSFHTNSHFLRAALEGICFSLKTILEKIEVSATPINQLNVSGGFVHSKVWMQILSDVTGKKLCLVQSEDASSVGAALLGMKALKIINDYNLSNNHIDVTIKPDHKNYTSYKNYYKVFKNIYRPLKKSMQQLNKMNN
jgi:gluconokinase